MIVVFVSYFPGGAVAAKACDPKPSRGLHCAQPKHNHGVTEDASSTMQSTVD